MFDRLPPPYGGRRVAAGFLILCAVIAARAAENPALAGPGVRAISSEERPRLVTLAEALSRFPEEKGIRYRAAGLAAEQPVTLILLPEDLKRAPGVLARHFGFAERLVRTAGGTFREIYASAERRRLADLRRRETTERAAEELTGEWDLWIQALDQAEPGRSAREALREFQPEAQLKDPAFRARFKLLAGTPPATRASLARGGRFVSQSYGALSPETRSLLDQAVPRGQSTVTATDAKGRVTTLAETSPKGSDRGRFVLQVSGPLNHRGLSLTSWEAWTVADPSGRPQELLSETQTVPIGFGTGDPRRRKEAARGDRLEA